MVDVEQLADVIAQAIETATAPLHARISALETERKSLTLRHGEQGPQGEKGDTGPQGEPGTVGPAGPQGERGERGERGADGDIGPQGLQGEPGRDGKDAEPLSREQVIDAIKAMPDLIQSAVAEYLTANPPAAGRDGRDGVDGKPGEKGADGRDGVGLASMLIDRSGELIATMTDGSVKSLGPIVGRDGAQGIAGKDGRDGLGFDDFEEEFDGERTFVKRYRRGDEVKEFRQVVPYVLDRGVYQAGRTYEKGDGVTMGGSFWIAQMDTISKPGDAAPESRRAWRLAVKAGRDAKPQVRNGNEPPPELPVVKIRA